MHIVGFGNPAAAKFEILSIRSQGGLLYLKDGLFKIDLS